MNPVASETLRVKYKASMLIAVMNVSNDKLNFKKKKKNPKPLCFPFFPLCFFLKVVVTIAT